MTGWRFGIVVGCCLLTGMEVAGSNCYAQSSSPQPGESLAASKSATSEKKLKRGQQSKDDSTSEASDPPENSLDYDNSLGPRLLKNLAEDQKAIWTSPARMRLTDVDWILPLGLATGGMLATDTEFSKHLSSSANRIKYSKDLSNYGIASLVGAGGGLYLWGHFVHDDHKRETGFLAAEAALDSLAVNYATKYAFGRERPLQDDFRGRFWQGGDSFPSEHATAAWSIASVIAHEYPGPLTSLLAYGAAAGISASRVTARQHFQSDVLIGSAIGWFVGQEVYRRHHDPELGGGDWETYKESQEEGPGRSATTSAGSPYVELDSWVYPAIERLAALGYTHSAFLATRPWTRIECAQLVEEAGDEIRADDSAPDEADRLYESLASEFGSDLERMGGGDERSVRLESVYARVTDISGPPLHDSYHFGQTIINDFGRPYEEGFNTYDGFSGYGSAGRFTIYVRGEYQHAPFAPPYSLGVREAIATADQNPVQPATPFAAADQLRLLDTYVAGDFSGWNFSFGKQSLWWGPGDGGALLFSDNAEPIYMFRGSRVSAFKIPLLSSVFGPGKLDFFVGKLSGNEFPPRPAIHGERITFKPTENFEFSFSRIAEFGGVGRPMTVGAIVNSYISVVSSVSYAANRNPGKRTSGFDFSYRPPLVRNWLTLYVEALGADDVTPLANPPRAAWNSGIYIPRIPRVPKLDFRFEGGYTDPYATESTLGEFVYWDSFYHDLSTNKGNVIGSWIGREGKGIQAWSTYWFSPRNSLQFGYRHAKVARDFIPRGETVNDGSVKLNWWLRSDLDVSGSVQYEKWLAPILAAGPQTNWTSTVQITFHPRF